MTYCVSISLNAGLIFLSDSRTNAGVDHIGIFRKMTVFEKKDDRLIVLMCAGNLSISQSIKQLISSYKTSSGKSIWTAKSMFEAAQIVGDAVRLVYERDSDSLHNFGIDFNASMILGGQINGEACRLFHIYSAGNFIEAQNETPYFQIGESKYGKPILDRVIAPDTSLDDAAKCALISMDSTLRSNISVGFPLDLLVYETNTFKASQFVTIDEENLYFQSMRNTWGDQLKKVFESVASPIWDKKSDDINNVLCNGHSKPLRIFSPEDFGVNEE